MIDISVHDLVKSFEVGKNVLDGLSFEVYEGERIGILGSNGAGKTTIFKILTGELDKDDGDIIIGAGKRIGLISQIPVFPPEYTAEDVLKTAHKRIYEIKDQMQKIEKQLEHDSAPELLQKYDRLLAEFQMNDGYELDRLRNTVANGLSIPQSQREQFFDTLSGGEKTRINLARLILENTDILLLDEPTNHLDMKATEWLEEYISKFKGTVLTISHDRYFLDKVVDRVIEIVDGKAEFYSGNYSFYVIERQRRFDEQMKKYEKDQAKLEQLKRAAEQMHLWAFMGNDKLHKRAFSMEKRMEKLSTTVKPHLGKKLNIKFSEREFSGDEVFVAQGLSKAYDEKVLFNNIEFTITPGERIAIIGDNGVGKSTLIKILMGEELPDSGFLRKGPAVKIAYLPQIIKFSHPERTLYDTMLYEENCTPQAARDRLGQFMFSGENVFKQVGTLSGGELSRLRLCMLMKNDINFLILDEPTNHLDIASREWIEDAIEDYNETLLFVSHDRYFINRFATRIWEFENGEIHDYFGTFEQYRTYKSNQANYAQIQKKAVETKQPKQKKKSGVSAEKQAAKLEKEIAVLEKKLEELEILSEENASDYERLMEIEQQKAEINQKIEEMLVQWEELI